MQALEGEQSAAPSSFALIMEVRAMNYAEN